MFLHIMKRAGFFPDTTVGFVIIYRETIQDETITCFRKL